mmetsp:Transcript_21423/g.49224  ORF Transcript_21423/g.49224 Transcript_21423/m.49224 type:complete len:247 (+) Transcript_21423:152-892(+)
MQGLVPYIYHCHSHCVSGARKRHHTSPVQFTAQISNASNLGRKNRPVLSRELNLEHDWGQSQITQPHEGVHSLICQTKCLAIAKVGFTNCLVGRHQLPQKPLDAALRAAARLVEHRRVERIRDTLSLLRRHQMRERRLRIVRLVVRKQRHHILQLPDARGVLVGAIPPEMLLRVCNGLERLLPTDQLDECLAAEKEEDVWVALQKARLALVTRSNGLGDLTSQHMLTQKLPVSKRGPRPLLQLAAR